MLFFDFFSRKRSSNQQHPNSLSFQTFILEPILTPSGIIDGPGDDTIDIDGIDSDLPDLDDLSADALNAAIADDLDIIPYADNPITIADIDSGVFTVGDTGQVSIDFLYDGGGYYKGQLAIFSLDGMENLDLDSPEFIQEAANRALSNSNLGHIVIDDATEGARFSGKTDWEGDFNSGTHISDKSFTMRPGDTFAVMLVPNGKVEQLANNPDIGGSVRPLFSLATANPDDAFHVGQIADVTGDGNTFVMEDRRVDGWTDQDYNDIIFRVTGATGEAEDIDDVINSDKDWRDTEIGQDIIEYVKAEAEKDDLPETNPDIPDPGDPDPDEPITTANEGNSTIFQPGKYITEPSTGDPVDIATDFVQNNPEILGVSADDTGDFSVTDEYVSPHNGATHVHLQQSLDGIEVFNGSINVTVTEDGQILSMGNRLVSNLGDRVNITEPVISAADAIQSAATNLGIDFSQSLEIVSNPGGKAQEIIFAGNDISQDNIPAKLMYDVQDNGAVRLVWNTVINTPDDWLEINVDAATGEVLKEVSWSSNASYTVFANPLEHPNDGNRTLEFNPHDPVASPFGWHDINGFPGAEYFDTRGNNVFAQEDMDANNTGGFRPNGGWGSNFNFPLNLDRDPNTYAAAAITNLFYWNNILHDIHYHYGFDEASGNFQQNNYGRGGLGGDAVRADALDGSGTNNANFATPPDGRAPRMQMYRFTNTTPNRDSSFDNGVIIHEYGHGVSNRLTGGPHNSAALWMQQSRSLGEGWSDFWAIALTAKATDRKTGRYPMGTYVLGHNPHTGKGIRRYPYSTDMSVNPLTYGDLPGSVCEATLNLINQSICRDT